MVVVDTVTVSGKVQFGCALFQRYNSWRMAIGLDSGCMCVGPILLRQPNLRDWLDKMCLGDFARLHEHRCNDRSGKHTIAGMNTWSPKLPAGRQAQENPVKLLSRTTPQCLSPKEPGNESGGD